MRDGEWRGEEWEEERGRGGRGVMIKNWWGGGVVIRCVGEERW